MKIYLLAIGTRMPAWVIQGYEDYARRLPSECALQLVEIPAGRRTKGRDMLRTLQDEGERMLKTIPKSCRMLALDERGVSWNTQQLSVKLGAWMGDGADLALLVGGPDGLSKDILARADGHWSLSPLTLPHPLVRVVVAEQLYRAWSLLRNHPYHRAG
jgi:23S rRNA (pseudouridine1915-N3)-methyltransferase